PNEGGTIRQPKKRSQNVPDEIKQQIRADHATGAYSYAALGKKYNYSPMTIWHIINGRNYFSSKPANVTVEPVQTATE
ncbi:MAG: hypothetical protein IJP68_12545, partial [Selenomonadaceae bacterium]|nr:hypothetical protein [Selenomonadaceae bacterium]